MNTIFKIRDKVEIVVEEVAVALMALIAVVIGLQVLLRAMNIGVQWTEEIARFSYVGVTFLGSVMAVTRGRHITITMLLDVMPKGLRKIFEVVIHIAMAGFMGCCAYGMTLIMEASEGVRSNSMPWFHLNYLYIIVEIGCIMMILTSLLRAVELAIKKPETSEEAK
ncbi:MAG: TRAP transporter small permease [Eubacteriales bacterium]|jgi:TRAP-type C4-dicarboxylate transport system permease small subunit